MTADFICVLWLQCTQLYNVCWNELLLTGQYTIYVSAVFGLQTNTMDEWKSEKNVQDLKAIDNEKWW